LNGGVKRKWRASLAVAALVKEGLHKKNWEIPWAVAVVLMKL